MNKIIIGVLPQILLKTDDNPYNDKYEFLDLYCKKIFSCGGIPIGICLNNGKLDKDVLDLCDAFLLPGGNKIWDCYYEVIDYAIRNNKPLLGICLGFQAISIYSMILDMGMSNFTIDNFIKSYEKLKEERETKNKILYDIDEENNSKEFKLVLSELIRNEDRIKEERVRLAKRNEYNERQKRIAEEQKIEAARVRRQKLIEEARLKEQLASTERLKKLQDETVISPINEEEKEEVKMPIPNPLKNKTFDNLDLDNDFDTDELFGKTKIVPNKVDNLVKKEPITEESKEEMPLWEPPVESKKEIKVEPIRKEVPDRVSDLPRVSDFVPKEAPKETTKEEVKDLFKEEDNKVELNIENKKEEESKKKTGSIYDLLENNKNIIWKSTGTSDNINKSTIPVIGNNNLKPEILGSSKVDDLAFPDMNKKEGEILWKETM